MSAVIKRQRQDYFEDPESRKFDHGLFLYNLPDFITQELLWLHIKQAAGHEQLLQVIVPRNRNTSKHPGYAFLQLQSQPQALELRKKINYLEILGTKVKVAVMGKKETHASVVIKNLPEDADEKALDDLCQKHGVVYSTKLDTNPNFGKTGKYLYVQFEKNAEADEFIKKVTEKKIEELKGETIQAVNWNRVATNETENQSLFFKEYNSAPFADNLFEDDKALEKETENIAQKIKEYYKDFDIISVYVKINPLYKSPISFVCFETHAEAERAQAIVQNDSANPFKFIVYCKTFEQLRAEREKKLDDKYIYIKNLKSTVTEETLRAAIEKVSTELATQTPIKVTSIRLQEPKNNPTITTKFATVILETNGQLQHLKQAAKNNTSEFYKLFEDKKAFVQLLHHKFFHKRFLQNKRNKLMLEQSTPNLNGGFGRFPFGLPAPQGLGMSRTGYFGQTSGILPPGLGGSQVPSFPGQLPPGLLQPQIQPQGFFQPPFAQPPFFAQNLIQSQIPSFAVNRFPNQQPRTPFQQQAQPFGNNQQRPQTSTAFSQQQYQQNQQQYPQFRQGFRGGQYTQGGNQRQDRFQGQGNREQRPQSTQFQGQNQNQGQNQTQTQTQNQGGQNQNQYNNNNQSQGPRPQYQGQQNPQQGYNRPANQGPYNQGGIQQGQNRPFPQTQNQGPRPNQGQGQGQQVPVQVQGNPKPITGAPKQIQPSVGAPKQIQGPPQQKQ